MRNSIWLCSVSVALAAAIGACGSSGGGTGGEGTSDGGTGGKTTTTTTTTTSATSSTTTSTTSSTTTTTTSGTTSSTATLVNGCDPATAQDETGKAALTIMFPAGGLKYSPACTKVSAGTMVTFSGDFSFHPLAGGVDGVKDPTSPIKDTTSGMSATFTLAAAGTFGFFCTFHQASGMEGAIFVE